MKPKNLKCPFTWESRRPLFADGVVYVPHFFEEHAKEVMPKMSGPIFIEYCSGNGDWIIGKAKQHPEIQWVAVEKRFDRVRKIWSKMRNAGLSNLLIVCGEACAFTRHYLEDNSIEGCYVNFPDPWPKGKHAKHRLFHDAFVLELSRVIKPNGKATIATDDPLWAARITGAFKKNSPWESAFAEPLTEWPDYGFSYFDDLWRKQGRTIHYLQFNNQKKMLWKFDFDLSFDEETFQQKIETIDHFVNEVWPKNKENIFGVSLFKGELDFSKANGDRLFYIDCLGQYWHRLVSFFPEQIAAYVYIDVSKISSQAFLAQAFSRHRFPYVNLVLEGAMSAYKPKDLPELGVCIPKDSHATSAALEQLDVLFIDLNLRNIPYRMISEEILTEEWNELNHLIVHTDFLSPQGRRKLLGFVAAGGEVVSYGESLGLEGELSYSEFLER